jgi:hypothetical protein
MDHVPRSIPETPRIGFPNATGVAVFEDRELPISADVSMSAEGTIEIQGAAPLHWPTDKPTPFEARLATEDGWQLLCEKCLAIQMRPQSFTAIVQKVSAVYDQEPDPRDASLYVALVGDTQILAGDTFDQFGSRSVCQLHLGGRDVYLYGAPLGGINNMVGYLYVPRAAETPEQDWHLVFRLCSLLSFAYGRFISPVWYSRTDSRGATRTELLHPSRKAGDSGPHLPILYVSYSFQVSGFLNRAWPRWDHEGHGLDLPALIDQYVLTRQQSFVESALMLGSIWMEAFKYQYAAQVRQYQQARDGYFQKTGSASTYSFRELVDEGMRYYGVPSPYLGFVSVRNSIVHTGTLGRLIKDKIRLKIELEDAIKEFFYTLFDFQGYAWSYRNVDWVERAGWRRLDQAA